MTARKDTKKDQMTIEETFAQLEDLIKKLESGDSSLEESFGYYESGMKLVKACNDKIDKVEKQIMVLEEKEGGKYEL